MMVLPGDVWADWESTGRRTFLTVLGNLLETGGRGADTHRGLYDLVWQAVRDKVRD